MRVSIHFVSLAIFFVGRSQCAPVGLENALNQRDLALLNSIPLLGSTSLTNNDQSATDHDSLLSLNPVAPGHRTLPLVGSISGIDSIVKRDPGAMGSGILGEDHESLLPGVGGIPLVNGGLSSMSPTLSNVEELGATSHIPSLYTIPFLNNAPSLGSIPGATALGSLTSEPTNRVKRSLAGGLPLFSSIPGLNSLGGGSSPPSMDSASRLNSLPLIGSVPGASSFSGMPSIPFLGSKRSIPGFGSFGEGGLFPGMDSISSLKSLPFIGSAPGLSGSSGIPAMPFLGAKRSLNGIASGVLADGNGLPIVNTFPALSNLGLSNADLPGQNLLLNGSRQSSGLTTKTIPAVASITALKSEASLASADHFSGTADSESFPLLGNSLPLVNVKRGLSNLLSGINEVPVFGSLHRVPGVGKDLPVVGSEFEQASGFSDTEGAGPINGLFGSN